MKFLVKLIALASILYVSAFAAQNPITHLNARYGYLIDSIQGQYQDGTVTAKVGGNGGSAGTFLIENASSIDVLYGKSGRAQAVRKIVIHYPNSRSVEIAYGWGVMPTNKVTYDLTDKVVVGIKATKGTIWGSATIVQTLVFELADVSSEGPASPVPAYLRTAFIPDIGLTFLQVVYTDGSTQEAGDEPKTGVRRSSLRNVSRVDVLTGTSQGRQHIYRMRVLYADGMLELLGEMNWNTETTVIYDLTIQKISNIVSTLETRDDRRGYWTWVSSLDFILVPQDPDDSQAYSALVTEMKLAFDDEEGLTFIQLVYDSGVTKEAGIEPSEGATTYSALHLDRIDVRSGIARLEPHIYSMRLFYIDGSVEILGSMDERTLSYVTYHLAGDMLTGMSAFTGSYEETDKHWVSTVRFLINALIDPSSPETFKFTIEITDLSDNIFTILANQSSQYSVDCENDGILDVIETQTDFSCSYDSTGIYTVSVSGNYSHFGASEDSKSKLRTIEQWGTTAWTSFEDSFSNSDLHSINALDSLNLTQTTSMERMFANATLFQTDASGWNTENVRNMKSMFAGASNFSYIDLSGWNVNKVTQANHLDFATSWGVDNTEPLWLDRRSGLDGAFKFTVRTNPNHKSETIATNSSFGEYNYNVDCNSDGFAEAQNVTTDYTCKYAHDGTYTISITGEFPHFSAERIHLETIEQWGNIQWRSFYGSFAYSRFKLNAIDAPDLSQVTDMRRMFADVDVSAEGDVSHWDTSTITDMRSFAMNSPRFNLDISSWDVSNVTDFGYAFYMVSDFNQDLSKWDVGSATTLYSMFGSAWKFTSDLSNWDVSNVTNMAGMLSGASSFTSDLSNWDVSNVTKMNYMFYGASSFNSDLSNWDVSNGANMSSMFREAASFSSNDLSRWDVSNVTEENHADFGSEWGPNNDEPIWRDVVFALEDSFQFTLSFGHGSTMQAKIKTNDRIGTYNYNIDCDSDGRAEAQNVTTDYTCVYSASGQYKISINGTFPHFSASAVSRLQTIEQWGNIQWKSFLASLAYSRLTHINATDAPDLSQVTDMTGLFTSIEQSVQGDVSHWDTSTITNMHGLAMNSSKFNLDISSWDVSNVTDFGYAFYMVSDFNQDLSEWDVGSAIAMESMFSSAHSFTSDLSNWDVSNVTNMSGMLGGALSFTSDLSNWDVSNATKMNYMFYSASSFNSDLSNWDVSNVTNMSSMFREAASFSNNDLSLWDVSNVTEENHADFGSEWGSSNIEPSWVE